MHVCTKLGVGEGSTEFSKITSILQIGWLIQHFHAESEILQRRIHPQDVLRSVGWPYERSVVSSQVTDTEAVSTPPLGQERKQDME